MTDSLYFNVNKLFSQTIYIYIEDFEKNEGAILVLK